MKEDGEEQAAVVVQDSPAEDIPAAQDEKLQQNHLKNIWKEKAQSLS